MIHLTADETTVLRITLGLHATQRRSPTQNRLHRNYANAYSAAVESLVARDFLYLRAVAVGRNPAGTYAATDAGREAVLDQPWK